MQKLPLSNKTYNLEHKM